MLYLGWILAAFLGGMLLTFWRVGKKRKPSLRRRFSAIDRYEGLLYDDILRSMNAVPQSTEYTAQGTMLRTWSETGYSITLIFIENDICLGVAEEKF